MKLSLKTIAALLIGALMLAVFLACGTDSGGGGSEMRDLGPEAGNWRFEQQDGQTGVMTIDESGKVTAVKYDTGSGDGVVSNSEGYGNASGEWVMKYTICWGTSCYRYEWFVDKYDDGTWKGTMESSGGTGQTVTLTGKV